MNALPELEKLRAHYVLCHDPIITRPDDVQIFHARECFEKLYADTIGQHCSEPRLFYKTLEKFEECFLPPLRKCSLLDCILTCSDHATLPDKFEKNRKTHRELLFNFVISRVFGAVEPTDTFDTALLRERAHRGHRISIEGGLPLDEWRLITNAKNHGSEAASRALPYLAKCWTHNDLPMCFMTRDAMITFIKCLSKGKLNLSINQLRYILKKVGLSPVNGVINQITLNGENKIESIQTGDSAFIEKYSAVLSITSEDRSMMARVKEGWFNPPSHDDSYEPDYYRGVPIEDQFPDDVVKEVHERGRAITSMVESPYGHQFPEEFAKRRRARDLMESLEAAEPHLSGKQIRFRPMCETLAGFCSDRESLLVNCPRKRRNELSRAKSR